MSARTVRKDAAQNRARIVDAARTAFGELGMDAATIVIARRAGVGSATVYRHFPSRDHLVTAVFGEQTKHCIAVLDEAVAHPDPWHGLMQALEAVIEMEIANPGLTQVITTERNPFAISEEFRVHAMMGLSTLAERLRSDGVVAPDFGSADILLVLSALRAVVATDRSDAAARSRRLIQHLTRGIQVRGRHE